MRVAMMNTSVRHRYLEENPRQGRTEQRITCIIIKSVELLETFLWIKPPRRESTASYFETTLHPMTPIFLFLRIPKKPSLPCPLSGCGMHEGVGSGR